MQVAFEDPRERLLELLIGQRVTKRIHRRIGVAQKVREHVPVTVDALAPALHEGQHMVRGPAQHETAQDERDRAERLPRAIFRL